MFYLISLARHLGMFLSRDPFFFCIYILVVVGSRTHGRGTFSLQQEKVPKKCRPKQFALRVPEAFDFANGSVQLASMLDEPQNSSMNFDPTKAKILGKLIREISQSQKQVKHTVIVVFS